MRSGFRVGKIFGISIYIDWSWIFIFLLVTWNLAAGLFPRLHPDWSLALNWGLGALASLVFFASVLAHELAHSLVALARGLPVRRITLFIFGGVSNIEKEPTSPGTEFWMAVVGPLTSLVLGIIFLVLGGASLRGILPGLTGTNTATSLTALRQLSPISTLLLWVGPLNLLLGIFNLIPGFPLDGGRVLRSILWAITQNFRRATHWATILGQIIAWLFILAGISMAFGVNIPFFGTGIISGLWLAFIGWFLNNAAAQSYHQVVVEEMLEGVPVSRIMRPNVPSVSPQIRVSDLVYNHIMGSDERAFPVLEGDQLIGMVSLDDVRKVPREAWDSTLVDQIMTPADKLDTVGPRQDLTDAFNRFAQRDVRQIPVVQDGHLVGMLSQRDIVRWLQLHSETQAGRI